MSKRLINLVPGLLLPVLVIGCLAIGVVFAQGRTRPSSPGEYVALGSSYAAGPGLGARASRTPLPCLTSSNSYPHQLARLRYLPIVDMTCSSATTEQVLHGGQYFQGPQVDAVGTSTKLVTLTSGGDDVSYVGDPTITILRARHPRLASLLQFIRKSKTRPVTDEDFAKLASVLRSTVDEIHRRAPQAQVVVTTYPLVLPPEGTCPALGIPVQDAAAMRKVAERLAQITRDGAAATGATLVDMANISRGHDACSREPWTNGATTTSGGAPFHPNLTGAQAIAKAINDALGPQLGSSPPGRSMLASQSSSPAFAANGDMAASRYLLNE